MVHVSQLSQLVPQASTTPEITFAVPVRQTARPATIQGTAQDASQLLLRTHRSQECAVAVPQRLSQTVFAQSQSLVQLGDITLATTFVLRVLQTARPAPNLLVHVQHVKQLLL